MSENGAEFVLREPYANGFSKEISEPDFLAFKQSYEAYKSLREVSRSYSVAAMSFVELECLLNEFSVRFWVDDYKPARSDDFFDEFTERCTLKTVTLLNAYSAFLDQTPQRLNTIQSILPSATKYFKEQCSKQYDSNADYRLFSCLRNFSQHHKLPIYSSSFNNNRHYDQSGDQHNRKFRDEVSIHPYISFSEILASKVKDKDRKLIENIKMDRADVKAIVRSFVSSFAEVYDRLVEDTSNTLDVAEQSFSQAHQLLSRAKGSDAHFVEICQIAQSREHRFGLVKEKLDQLRMERAKWGGLIHTHFGSTTGKIVFHKDTYLGSREELLVPK